MDGTKRKPLLNGRETAAALGIDPKTLRAWLRDGKCPVPPMPGKPPKWRRLDVETFTGEPA